MLDGTRVLDLTDERGNLAGQVLASFGAEVIAVEPPGGQPARRLAPFAGDVEHHDRSLVHWSFNRGKRSVVLDLRGSAVDRERFRHLVGTADVVIETAAPGELEELDLGYADLAAINPALVHVSITPFGSDGPKAGWKAPDLVALAAGGQLLLSGDADRAPVRCSVPQAWIHASGDALDGALIALWARNRTGRGAHVDVSAQQSVMQATQSMVLAGAYGAPLGARIGGGMRLGPLDVRLVWPCLDGTVSITFLFGASVGPFSERLFRWIWEEGGCDEATRDKDWVMFGTQLHTGEETVEEFDRLKSVLDAFVRTKTKQELLDASLERKLLIAPASTIEDVYRFEHFVERDYWDRIHHSELDLPAGQQRAHARGKEVRYPGPVARPSTGRLPSLAPAPALGEGTLDVLDELATRPTSRAALAGSAVQTGGAPLEGLRVLDFMWSLAGPSISRVLTDHGATVVRVESSKRVEMGRTLSPFWQDKPDPEGSGVFLNANTGKLGVCLDLRKTQGRQIVLDLARWADVVCESYSPGAMARWGIDYDELKVVNPDLVMLSSSLLGQTGPLAGFAGFGNLGAAMAGFFHTTGWPDRTCVGPYGGYTDYLSPRFGVAALMSALLGRGDGEGCHVDFSQTEAAMWALGPALLEYEVNGRVWARAGNDDRNLAPHVVAPAAGADRWVAIVCEDDDQWRALCDVASFEGSWRQLTAPERLARRRELDELVGEWTADQDAAAVAASLQACGVAAHPCDSAIELWDDPQLAHRGHWAWVDHERHGRIPVEAPRFRIDGHDAAPLRAAPTLGQDTFAVLAEILGYDADRIADLAAAEVLE